VLRLFLEIIFVNYYNGIVSQFTERIINTLIGTCQEKCMSVLGKRAFSELSAWVLFVGIRMGEYTWSDTIKSDKKPCMEIALVLIKIR